MTVVQVVIILFVLFAVWRTVAKFREGSLSAGWLVFWCVVWAAAGVAAVLPRTTEWFARLIGVGRGVDAVIYASIIFLFYLVFRIFLRLEKIEHDITLVVRKGALGKLAGDGEGEKADRL